MASRKRKRFWNEGGIPELGEDPPAREPPKPLPDTVSPSHSTPGAPEQAWLCLRCERIRAGNDPAGLDHTPRCRYRNSDEDPPVKN